MSSLHCDSFLPLATLDVNDELIADAILVTVEAKWTLF